METLAGPGVGWQLPAASDCTGGANVAVRGANVAVLAANVADRAANVADRARDRVARPGSLRAPDYNYLPGPEPHPGPA